MTQISIYSQESLIIINLARSYKWKQIYNDKTTIMTWVINVGERGCMYGPTPWKPGMVWWECFSRTCPYGESMATLETAWTPLLTST